MSKFKPCKGLLKRIRFTKSGRVKFRRASGRHRRSHKSGKQLRSYRKPRYASSADLRRIRLMTGGSVRTTDATTDASNKES